jgi:uncharacterized protein (TIGR03437 family)
VGHLRVFLLGFISCCAFGQIQTAGINCTAAAVNPLLRSEGVTERVGDIVLNCAGGTPGAVLAGNLTVFLGTNITNKITSDNIVDVILTADQGNGPVLVGVPARLASNVSVVFTGVSLNLSPAGTLSLRISNLRGAANMFGGTGGQSIIARLAFNAGGLTSGTESFSVGVPTRGLLASTVPMLVNCNLGSPLPESISFANLLAAGSAVSSTRITEGFADAFQKRGPMSDNGTRFILRFTGFPVGARLFAPNLIAGSDAVQPTRAGDFGGVPSPGQYAASSAGTLLLARVIASDANGAGGAVLTSSDFGSMTEILLAGGSGNAVYEVLDANPTVSESAQIPVFLGYVPTRDGRVITTGRDVQFAPISNSPLPSATAPIPRFAGGAAPTDCTLLGDCSGAFLPKLFVDTPTILFTTTANIGFQYQYVSIGNAGGGALVWGATVDYKSGKDWIHIDKTSGINGGVIRVDVMPQNLTAVGTYEATLTVDAGPQGGLIAIPITARVLALPPPAAPKVSIGSVTNAATFVSGPLVRGSLGTLKGANLSGSDVAITFDGLPARILYSSSDQINFQVPVEVGTRVSSQVVVTVGGNRSAPVTVTLADAAPGIFNPGILNQDNTVQSAMNPAQAGSIVQIFSTGLLPPEGGKVEVKLHDRILSPIYADAAPGLSGVQQVNLKVPVDLPTMTTEVMVCNITGAQRACSAPAKISLRQ